MWKTVVRRVLIMIPQLFVLSVLVFLIGKMMPGDPFTGIINSMPDIDAARIEELREKAGLNDPWSVQYKNWITKIILHGDFGVSYTYKIPVKDKIKLPAQNTLWLSLFTVMLTYAIAVPLGIRAGRYNGSKFDKAVLIYNFITYAIPTFILSLLSLLLFGYQLRIFPTSGFVGLDSIGNTGRYIASRIYHMLLPAMTAAVLRTTGIVQYLRNEVIDAKSQDYVKTARSKGVPIDKVYSHHIFRNSLLPIAAFFGFTITGLLAGSIFVETIFMYQGMGLLFIESIMSRDYSVINALTLLYGTLALFGSLLSDIIMIIVDPRIRIE
ncbi:ABC transporter permease [Treponema sp.]|uniref:ABC transporter permease n=1 Tax=Treponema sp. TaxID=166 RepID=UPI003FA1ED7C